MRATRSPSPSASASSCGFEPWHVRLRKATAIAAKHSAFPCSRIWASEPPDTMSARDLLFELGTEELPPRTLQTLSSALAEGLEKGLSAAGIAHGTVRSFATPRRLAVLIRGVAARAEDRRVERRGPPVRNAFDAAGHPTQAATAFARVCGVEAADLERLTTDKGSWLVYRGTEPGAATTTLLGGIVDEAIAQLPIARRMRW